MMKSLITSGLALAALSVVGTAQSQLNRVPVQGQIQHATLHAATGELVKDGAQQKAATLITTWANTDGSGWYSRSTGRVEEWLDWGVLNSSVSDIVGAYQFAYATTAMSTSIGGPGVSICTDFYAGATGWCALSGSGTSPDAEFCWTGLPGVTSGGNNGWIITVTLSGGFEFQMPNGPFGYSNKLVDFASGPLLCYAGTVSGAPDANGSEDVFDVYVPDVTTVTQCGSYWFGGAPSNYSSWWMYIQQADNSTLATSTLYCGSGVNLGGFSVTGDAVLGGTFSLSLTHSRALGLLFGYASPLTFPYKGQEILVNFTDPNGELLGNPGAFGSPAIFNLGVPINLFLCGFTVYVQAVSAGGGVDLHCAYACTVGF